MPQELDLVYYVETGEPRYMHSVDANEAVLLGDYVRQPPFGEVDPKMLAAAKAVAKGMNAEIHPEMLSPEERQRRREEANQHVMPVVTMPTDTPVVVKAGDVPEPAAMRQQAQQQEHRRRQQEEHQSAHAMAQQEEKRQEAQRQEAEAQQEEKRQAAQRQEAEAQRERQQQARQAAPQAQSEKK